MMFLKNKFILPISIFFFLTKWFFIIYFNQNIDFLTNIIFDLEDHQYFPLIFNLSNFNFNPTYDLNITNTNFITFPIYSIIYHSFFFKILNVYSFIVVDFFLIIIFLYLFTYFLEKAGLNQNISTLIGLLILILPNIISFFHLSEITYVNAIKELYTLRVPRPSVSHLYFFLFIYLLVRINKTDNFSKRTLILIGAIFAFMFSSFYYNLAISGFIFLLYYFYISLSSKKKIQIYFKEILIVFITFIIFSIPTFLNLMNAETDYLVRVGLINLDLEKKIILINHFFNKILSISFMLIFVIMNIFYYILKSKSSYKIEILNLLYFIFLSSFISPVIFILISPNISEIYHFTNMLVALSFFVFLIYLSLILNFLINDKTIFQKQVPTFIIALFLAFYVYDSFHNIKKNSLLTEKLRVNELIKDFNKKNFNKNINILSFDEVVQTNLILRDYKNFSFMSGIHTSLNDESIEDRLINVFKFLNLNKDSFLKFIENKKEGWRYINNNIGKTFYMKYQANKLTTFKESDDFTNEETTFIRNSSPLHSQQLIIPTFEIERLKHKFNNFENLNKIKPKLIIINNEDDFSSDIKIDNNLFCKVAINQTYTIYLHESLNAECFKL